MRAQGDPAFSEWLLAIGTGQVPPANGITNPNIINIPDKMLLNIPNDLNHKEKSKDDEDTEEMPIAMLAMVQEIYGNSVEKLSTEELSKRAILASTNKEVLKINNFIIQSLSPKAYTYLSYDQVRSDDCKDRDNWPAEMLNSKTPSSMPPHKLILKVGTIIMLLRNIRPKEGLSNGTRLQVTALSINGIEARIISEKCRGQVHFLFRMDLTSNDSSLPCTMLRRQFPIIPAYAITINKSQGQTLEHVGVYLTRPVFGHGQMYVALSRCTTQENIKVYVQNLEGQQGDLLNDGKTFTLNVVYREVFRHGELKDDAAVPADNNLSQDNTNFEPDSFKKPTLTAKRSTASTASMRTVSEVEGKQKMTTTNQSSGSTASMRTASEVKSKQKMTTSILSTNSTVSMRTLSDVEEELKKVNKKPNTQPKKPPVNQQPKQKNQPERSRTNQFVLFQNVIYIEKPRQRRIYNMCLHNATAQGLICLMKVDPIVQKYISDISPLCEYFRILIAATYEENSALRNEYWGNFILSKAKNIPADGDMAGDVAEITVETLMGHISFTNTTDYGTVPYSALEVTARDHGGLTNFPNNILEVFKESGKNSQATFHDLLFIMPSNFQTILPCISQSFEHAGDTYQLKMIVNYEGEVEFIANKKKQGEDQHTEDEVQDTEDEVQNTEGEVQEDESKKKPKKKTEDKPLGHYTTYVKDYQNNRWWHLNDLANKETVETKIDTKPLTVSLMVFARQSPDWRPDSDDEMQSDYDDDGFKVNDFDNEEEIINVDSDESEILDDEEDYEDVEVDRTHELAFSNRMTILDCRLKEPFLLKNMCPHNSVAHGFIFLYKHDPDVCRYIRAMAKHSKYFQTLLHVIDQRCKTFRNEIWGNFTKYKVMHRTQYRPGDMFGNPTRMIDLTMANHASFFRNNRPIKYLTLNPRCERIKFPDVLLSSRTETIFKEILIIDCSDITVSLDNIQLFFLHNNEEYRFKFLVQFDGIKFTQSPGNHFRTYAYHDKQHEWWILDDQKTDEQLFDEELHDKKIMVSLMVYGKSVPENFEPQLKPSHPSYQVETSEESEVYMSEEEDSENDEVLIISDGETDEEDGLRMPNPK